MHYINGKTSDKRLILYELRCSDKTNPVAPKTQQSYDLLQ